MKSASCEKDGMIADGDEICYIDKFLGDDPISKLCSETWSKKETIKRIILRGNCISPRGIQALAPVLSANKDLVYLSLEWNQIGSSGALGLSGAIEDNKRLQYIDLKNNSIGDDGAIALALCMERNSGIKTLDLRWNQIGDRGMESFKRLLEKRGNFNDGVCLLFQGNPISLSLATELEQWSLTPEERKEMPVRQQHQQQENVKPIENMPVVHDVLLTREDFKEMRDERKQIEAEKDDLIRQLDASAIQITDLEQSLMREKHKSSRLGEEITLHTKRLSDQANEFRRMTEQWEEERLSLEKENRDKVADLDQQLKAALHEKDSYRENQRKAEEEKGHTLIQFEQLEKQAEVAQEEMQEEISKLTAQVSEISINEARMKSELFSTSASLQRYSNK